MMKSEESGSRSTYTLVRCVAHDSCGDVFLAEDDNTGKQVAIQVIDLENVRAEEVAAGSRRVALHSQLKSVPHMKTFVGSYLIPNTTKLCHVSEYLDYSVTDILECHQVMSECAISEVLRIVLVCLDYLHDKSVAHEIVRASNITLDKSGTQVKLCPISTFHDKVCFALIGEEEFTPEVPYWSAPEVVGEMEMKTATKGRHPSDFSSSSSPPAAAEMKGEEKRNDSTNDDDDDVEAGPSSLPTTSQDIWSVGISALEMSLGYPPFADLDREKAHLLLREGESSRAIPRHLSKTFQHFLSLCLSKDPASRPTARELLKHKFIIKPAKGPKLQDYLVKVREQNTLVALTPRFGINVPGQNSTEFDDDDDGGGNGEDWDFEFGENVRAAEASNSLVISLLEEVKRQMSRNLLTSLSLPDTGMRNEAYKDLEDCFSKLKEFYLDIFSRSEQQKVEESVTQFVGSHFHDRLTKEFKANCRTANGDRLNFIQQNDLDVKEYIKLGLFSRFVVKKWKERMDEEKAGKL